MGLRTVLLCFLAMGAFIHVQSQSGFISIDCGRGDGPDYNDPWTNISYSSDVPYIDTGVNMKVFPYYKLETYSFRYADLRSFPNGTRNCYTLAPVQRGAKYLVRAGFVYGNYDGQNRAPEFDLYLGVNFWQTVRVEDRLQVEILAVAPAGSMQVCLVNKGRGTPFISVLELRPLADSTYTLVNESQSLVLQGKREDLGGNPSAVSRYPADPFDRIWYAPDNQTGWTQVINDRVEVKTESVPSFVMKTAVTTASLSQSLNFTVPGDIGDKIYLFMHFAELRQLGAIESRVFNVYVNSTLRHGPYMPTYLRADQVEIGIVGAEGTYTYSLTAAGNSTLPPILNALEVYSLLQLSLKPTDDRDADAIMNIKKLYQMKRNWVGDPCAPKEFAWEGLNCSYDASEHPRIISLNLSFGGLVGGIPASLVNLTALETLDLSHNNFTGEIPGELSELRVLRFLNLSSNQLNGSIPQILAKKSHDGSLSLSIDGNPNLCNDGGPCEVVKKKKKKIRVAIIIAAPGSLVLLVIILILIWLAKRRRKPDVQENKSQEFSKQQLRVDTKPQMQKQKDSLQRESHQFTFSEIASITNNFQKVIGKGGFGIVYHGDLSHGTQVAVKILSKTSSQGAKEFQAEAQVLTRVHHKNLVSLLGYCNDESNLALVYEFMPQGSLDKHLSGNSDNINGLSWKVRLTIALEAAQGLDYLHNGCKPSIVHRDVKAANILLNQNFGAKLADFGLSRAFSNEEVTHVSTVVVGTIGYLDPEYYQTSKLNEKSDVYSFGVVLLELITGQPSIFGGSEKINIIQWVLSKMERGDKNNIVDHRLQGNYDANSAWKVLDIAIACVSSPYVQRPTMSEVVMQLKECLASEAGRNYSAPNVNIQSLDSIETIP